MKIEVKDIRKAFGKKQVLNGVSLESESGKCIGILGKNGCGKSTLLSILAGVLRCDTGQFLIDGHSLFDHAEDLRRYVGYVPQVTPLIRELSARDNLLLWYTKEQLARELDGGVLDMLGIGAFLKTPVAKMSVGMQKRLSIGCAMQTRPPLLLLDEPCAALDIECKLSILNYLKEYKRQGGSLLIVSHDPMEMELCDACMIMRDGVLHDYDFEGDIPRLVNAL